MGAIVPLPRLGELARLWYRGRLAPDWRRRTADETLALFESVGLTGDFWRFS